VPHSTQLINFSMCSIQTNLASHTTRRNIILLLCVLVYMWRTIFIYISSPVTNVKYTGRCTSINKIILHLFDIILYYTRVYRMKIHCHLINAYFFHGMCVKWRCVGTIIILCVRYECKINSYTRNDIYAFIRIIYTYIQVNYHMILYRRIDSILLLSDSDGYFRTISFQKNK